MDVYYEDKALQELYETGLTTDKRYKRLCRDRDFISAYQDAVRLMEAVSHVSQLRQFSYLHYESLKYRAESSIRIDNGRVERLLFTEHDNGVTVKLIELNSTHYGKKR